jgi:spore germination cell wall hydrolase CwlJ-like protein
VKAAFLTLLSAAALARGATQAEVVAATLVLEAGTEGRRGMEAVREVIVNRALARQTHQFAVVSEPRQFSCWNGRRLVAGVAEARSSPAWPAAWAIIHGPRTNHVGDATHYYAPRLASPAWAAGRPARTIGRHAFLRL